MSAQEPEISFVVHNHPHIAYGYIMNIVSGITLYTILWWMVFFCVLPIGMRQPTQRVTGEMPGAPEGVNIKRKAVITTAIAALFWLVIYLLVQLDIYSFRNG